MSATVSEAPRPSPAWGATVLRRLVRDPVGVISLVLVSTVVMMAVGADWLSSYNPLAIDIRSRLEPPSLLHLLGTDHLGRDIFARLLHGARIALSVALSSISLAVVIGSALGLIAGYGASWVDKLLVLAFDTVRSYPTIMFALAIVTLLGPSLATIILVIVVTTIPTYGRVVRTQVMATKNTEFVQAARAMGAGPARVLCLHILPNVAGPLFILASMDIAAVVAIEAGLSFLGLGVRPPTPSWGTVLNDGYTYIGATPWPIIGGCGALIVTTLGFTFLGEALRDAIDPKLRRTR